MEEDKKPGASSHMTSAAAFVEGGIQDSCDDACSICLEEFSESDPSTVTNCKHDFHLQCILEWCQRSSDCPMCLQPISLKDPASQELFEGVERERNLRTTPPRSSAVFHHPILGDFQMQHSLAGDAELEERILQHLAAVMGRNHHFVRREGRRHPSSARGRPHLMLFSTHPGVPPSDISSSVTPAEGESEPAAVTDTPSPPVTFNRRQSYQPNIRLTSSADDQGTTRSESSVIRTNPQSISLNTRRTSNQPSSADHNRAGSSEVQSLSESLKSKLNAVSMRYRESITKSTRGWKERLFSRNSSSSKLGSEIRREVVDGPASASHMINFPQIGDNNRDNRVSFTNRSTGRYAEINKQNNVENHCLNESSETACADSSSTS